MELKKDTTLAKQSQSLIESYRGSYPKSITDAIRSESNSLATIRKEQGEKVCIAFLIRVLADCVEFFNVGKSMNDAQLVETCKLIMNEFYFLKVSDLQLFFQRFKTGYYGQLFDRLDGSVIMISLRAYCEERITTAESLSLEAHKTAIDEERKENYLIQIGSYYLRSNGDDFEEVEKKELATGYTYGVAVRLRDWIVREQYPLSPETIKIVDRSKVKGLFEMWATDAPHLLPDSEKFKRSTKDYYEQRDKIRADESLTELEKENAIRKLANLAPITQEEFNEQIKYYKQ